MKTYFILDAKHKAIKIGRSVNPERRLRQLQTGHASPLTLLAVLDGDHEKRLHGHLTEHHLSGEWFDQAGVQRVLAAIQLRQPSAPKAVAAAKNLGGIILPERHAAIMKNAFIKAREWAKQQGLPLPHLLPLTVTQSISVEEHHSLLNQARWAYLTASKDYAIL